MSIEIWSRLIARLPKSWKLLARNQKFAIPFGVYVNLRSILERPNCFGQIKEDLEIARWCPESYGKYIDIGAGYPVKGSNSYIFYKRGGWQGIAIEPILSNCQIFRIFRRNDRIINALVGNENIEKTFFQISPYEYSTIDESVAEERLADPKVKLLSRTKIVQIKLSDLKIEMTPDEPSFMSIDCEGADLDVLKSNDWSTTRPRIVCVEEFSDRKNPSDNVTTFLEGVGYRLVATLSPSLVFVANEYQTVDITQ